MPDFSPTIGHFKIQKQTKVTSKYALQRIKMLVEYKVMHSIPHWMSTST